jgi:hypothetical protein
MAALEGLGGIGLGQVILNVGGAYLRAAPCRALCMVSDRSWRIRRGGDGSVGFGIARLLRAGPAQRRESVPWWRCGSSEEKA